MDGIEATAANTPVSAESPRWRIWASRVFLILFCISMVLSVVGIWARNQIVDTDRYIRTVSPLVDEPAFQAALVARTSNQIYSLLDDVFTRDTQSESERDRILAAPLQSLLEDYINQTVQEFVTSDQFPPIWEEINRASHALAAAVLTGKDTQSITNEDGQITLDIALLLDAIIARLSERGIPLVDRMQVENWDTTFVVFESDALADAQGIVHLLERLALVLPIVALLSLAAAIVLSVNRRQTIAWSGLGLAVAMATFLLLLAFVRKGTVDALPTSVHKDAATVFFETVGRYLRTAARLLALLGLLIAAIAYFFRPGNWAKRETNALWKWITSVWSSVQAKLPSLEEAGAWLSSHPVGLAVAIGVITCLLAIAWDPLSITGATAIILMAAVAYGVLLLLRSRMSSVALASPGAPATVAVGAAPVGRDTQTVQMTASSAASRSVPPEVDAARADLVALAGELPAEDVRMLRRIGVALRGSDEQPGYDLGRSSLFEDARDNHRVLNHTRTIADLAGSESVDMAFVAGALQFRPRQFSFWPFRGLTPDAQS